MTSTPDPDTVAYTASLTRDEIQALQAHHEAAHAVIAIHHGLGIQIDWAEVRFRAQTEVDALWPQISAVAHAAADKGRLTGAEIIRLLAPAA